jgi:hypothetical protein
MGSKGRYLKKCQKPSCPKESKETWTKYTLLTLLSQRCAKFTFCVIKSVEELKKIKTALIPYSGLELTKDVIKSSVADPDPGIRCLFDPWIRDPE